MKMESLVIANQNVAVNLYLGLAHTARHVPGVSLVRSFLWLNVKKIIPPFCLSGFTYSIKVKELVTS